MLRFTSVTLPLIAMALSAQPASAEGTWTLGLIADHDDGPYVGSGDEVDLLPYIQFETDLFDVSLHDGLSFRLLGAESAIGDALSLNARLAPRYAPGFSDDAVFDGLERDTAIEIGLEARYELPVFFVAAEGLYDVSDTHGGSEFRVSAGVEVEFDRFGLELEAGALVRSADLNQYLVGVSAAEATATRATYDAPGTTTGFAELTGYYALTDNMALVGQVSFVDYGELIDSPLLDRGQRTSLSLGVLMQF